MQSTLFPVINEKTKLLPLFLTSIGYDYNEIQVDRPQGYVDFQWLQTTQGEGELRLAGKKYILNKDTGVFLYPDEPHYYSPISDQWVTEWMTFNGKDAANIAYGLGFHTSGISQLSDLDRLSKQIRRGYSIAVSAGEYRGLDTANYLFDTLTQIVKSTKPLHRVSYSGQYNRLSPIINHLEGHYHLPLDLRALAESIDVSPQYLCTLFKNVTGNRPALYLNHLRINKAKELMLIHPEKTIAEIAFTVGFESPSYFSAIFKRHEDMTPGQFIALHRS